MINEKIRKQALELSKQERAKLAHKLIDSLHPVKEFQSEEAWSNELKKRVERYEEEESATTSWNDVKSRLS